MYNYILWNGYILKYALSTIKLDYFACEKYIAI